MKTNFDHKTLSRILSTIVLTTLFALSLVAPFNVNAQSPGQYQLFGVNLSGTLPWMDYETAGRDVDGKTITDGKLSTPDGRLTLTIPAGTFIRTSIGQAQPFISATMINDPPPVPPQQNLIIAYALGTPGATFNPTVGLAFSYDDSQLLPSVAETSLYAAWWNGTEWVKLSSTVDPATNTVATSVSNFTTYALFGSIQPPATTNTTSPPTSAVATTTPPPASTTASPPATSTEPSNFLTDSPLTVFLLSGAVVLIIILFLIARKQ